jgi:2,4-dienoyl-CoA reductase (NADPH2)
MNPYYPLLASPLRIGGVTVRNRAVLSAHLTNFAEENLPSDRLMAYYAARAAGGVGMIITEEQSVHPSDHAYQKLIQAYREEVLPGYRRLTNEIHRYGVPILAQINHNGAQGSSRHTRVPLLGPSSVADRLFNEVPKAADTADLRSIVWGYAETAERCERGGFDGVELQCSHSSIVRQFLSPHTNLRTDAYGGDLPNRMRLLREIVAAIRERVRRGFVIGVRLCGDEFQPDGITLDEAVETAVRLEVDRQVDYINTSIGVATESLYLIEASMRVPPDYAMYIPAAVRRETHLPVVGVGRIKDPGQAERILAAGWADLVGIVRAQVADSDFVRKALDGETDQIRICLSCNQECVGRVGINRWMGCIENVATGREGTHHERLIHPTVRARRVAVVGGGPGGMEAARMAALAGHRVSLFEQAPELGGQVRTAVKAPGRAEFGELIRNLSNAMYQLKVDLHVGTRMTAERLLAERYDDIILATGARHAKSQAPLGGVEASWVYAVTDILDRTAGSEKIGPGDRVLVIDGTGFHETTGVVEALADRGARVEVVTSSLYVAADLGITLDFEHWSRKMAALGVQMTPDTVVFRIGDHAADGIDVYTDEPRHWENLDAVVVAFPPRPEDELYRELKGRHPSVRRVGDCVTPRRAHAAIIEGNVAGRAVGAAGTAESPSARMLAPAIIAR